MTCEALTPDDTRGFLRCAREAGHDGQHRVVLELPAPPNGCTVIVTWSTAVGPKTTRYVWH